MYWYPFQQGSPKISPTSILPTLLPSKEVISYKDEEVNKVEKDLNQFDLPPIIDECGDEELLKFEDYGDEELLDFEELEEDSIPSSFCEEEELPCKEELHLSLYQALCFHQEDKVEVTRDFYSSSFLVSSQVCQWFQVVHPSH